MSYDPKEQDVVLDIFREMLRAATADGGSKRARGEKPPWWEDLSHEAAIFSHLSKWKHGEVRDKDSGAHPLVHLAWRALAIAYQETNDCQAPPAVVGEMRGSPYDPDQGRPPTQAEREDVFRAQVREGVNPETGRPYHDAFRVDTGDGLRPARRWCPAPTSDVTVCGRPMPCGEHDDEPPTDRDLVAMPREKFEVIVGSRTARQWPGWRGWFKGSS